MRTPSALVPFLLHFLSFFGMSGHNGTADTAAIGGVFVEIIFSML